MKKILSLVLAMLMILSTFPLSTLAEEWKDGESEWLEEVPEFPEENEAVSEEGEFVPETEPETSEEDEVVYAEEEEDLLFADPQTVASGFCGGDTTAAYNTDSEAYENLWWTLTADGTLTISGEGEMTDYAGTNSVTLAPWGAYIEKVKKIVLEEGITRIGNYAFYECSGFTGDLVIPDSVTTIGDSAFYYCRGFTGDLVIPDSVTTIGGNAFYYCRGFTGNLVIPNSITSIGDWVFADCSGFTGDLVIPNSVTYIDRYAFSGCSGFTGDLVIPNSVTTIGDKAFDGCTGFTGNLIIGDSVTTIGDSAFYYCRGFTGDLVIPDSVTTIGDKAFYNCRGFTGNLVIPNSITSIGDWVFADCSGFTGDLVIPDSVTSIGERAFRYCSGFTGDLVIPDSVTSIEGYAFYYCSGFTGNLVIPKSITSIGSYAFDDCKNLAAIYFRGSAPDISTNAFSNVSTVAYYPYGDPTWTADKLQNYGGHLTWKPYYPSDGSSFNGAFGGGGGGGRGSDVYSFVIKENKNDSKDREMKYRLAAGVDLRTTNGKGGMTGDGGSITLSKPVGTLTISKDGYVSRTYTEAQLKKSTNLYLQKVDAEYPVISGVWMDDVDILNEEYGVDLLDSDTYIVTPEIDWGESGTGSVKLMQGGQSVNITGSSLSIKWSDYFDVSGSVDDIYIVATNKNGKTARHPLKLKAAAALEALDGYSFNFTDKLSFTIPASAGDLFGGSKINLGLYTSLPVETVIEDGKFYIAIGYQNGASIKDGKKEVKSFVGSVKKILSDIKKAPSDIAKTQAIKDGKKILGNKVAVGKGALAFDANFSIMGFAEGYINADGKLVFVDSGMIIDAEGSVNWALPFYAGPVPMFLESQLKGELETAVNLYIDEQAKAFTPNMNVDFDISLSGGVGIGFKDILSASGGLKGKLGNTWGINFGKTDYFQMKATLSAYAKVAVLFAEFSKDWDIADSVWIEYPEKKAATKMPTLLSGEEIYNTSNYELTDISYLAKTQKRLLGAAKGLETSELVQNAYRSAKPQIVSFADGTKLAVWIGYNGANSSYDALNLYASYFDGTSWSQAAVIEDDGTYDAEPCLKLIDGSAYVVWMDASATLPADVTLDSLATLMDISMAKFDKAENSFTTVSVSSDNTVDMIPTVCGKGGTVYAVWEKNETNDWFGQSDNMICARAWTEEGLGNMETPYSGLSMIGSLAASYDGEDLHIAYSMDTDGDLSTTEDMEVFIDGIADENEVVDSGVTETNGVFWWYQGGNLVSSEGEKIENFAYDRYQVVDENGVKAVGYIAGNGLSSTLMAQYYDSLNRAWSEPVALTDGSKFVSSFCLSGKDGQLEAITNEYDVIGDFESGDPYGTANIRLYTIENKVELQIEDVFYDAANYIAGSDMMFDVAIKNSGTKTAEMINIVLKGKNGTILSDYMYNASILPGVTKTVTCGFTVENVDPAEEVTITVEDSISETVSLAYEDVALENISYGESADGKTLVYADIVNYGNTESGKLTVKLRKDAADGDCLAETVVESIAPLSMEHVSFELESAGADVYFVSVENSEKEEENLANNMDFVVLFDEAELTAVLGDVNDDGFINVIDANIVRKAAAKLITLTDSQNLAADVNDDGNVDVIDANLIRRYAAKLITEFSQTV